MLLASIFPLHTCVRERRSRRQQTNDDDDDDDVDTFVEFWVNILARFESLKGGRTESLQAIKYLFGHFSVCGKFRGFQVFFLLIEN